MCEVTTTSELAIQCSVHGSTHSAAFLKQAADTHPTVWLRTSFPKVELECQHVDGHARHCEGVPGGPELNDLNPSLVGKPMALLKRMAILRGTTSPSLPSSQRRRSLEYTS